MNTTTKSLPDKEIIGLDNLTQFQEAQELKLRCIRQAGTILLPSEQGGMTGREPGKRTDIETSPTDLVRLIEEAGISDEAARVWQKVARVPGDKIQVFLIVLAKSQLRVS